VRRVPKTAALLALGALAGCTRGSGGGGGGTSVAPASSAAPAPSGPLSTDAALQAALAQAGVKPVTPPAPDSAELIELGQALFFDKLLSGNKNISCATCHGGANATGDASPVSIGEGGVGAAPQRQLGTGQLIARNASPLFNLGVPGMDAMFWDSRVTRDHVTGELKTPELLLDGPTPSRPQIVAQLTSALAAQAMFPPTTPEEMRGQLGTNELANAVTNEDVWTALMARLVGTKNGTVGGVAAYRALFQAAYPQVTSIDDFNFGHAAQAIAAFERASFTALDSPFDHYLAGDTTALTDGQKRGALLFFGRARCAQCHQGPLLTDLRHHALATPQLGPGKFEANEDRGRGLVTGDAADDYRFRTPPLRNVAATGPWLHDGAFTTLEGAVRHHLDPAGSTAAYDPSQLPALWQPTVDTDPTRTAARLAAVDPLLGAPLGLSNADVSDLLDFLNALTDSASLARVKQLAPQSVPSGLPVPD